MDCLGKQVKILYEPVAVRHMPYIVRLTESHISGNAIGDDLRRPVDKRAKSKYPSAKNLIVITASAGF